MSSDMEKLIFARKPIFGVEKCPQIQGIPKRIKVLKREFLFIIHTVWANEFSVYGTQKPVPMAQFSVYHTQKTHL